MHLTACESIIWLSLCCAVGIGAQGMDKNNVSGATLITLTNTFSFVSGKVIYKFVASEFMNSQVN